MDAPFGPDGLPASFDGGAWRSHDCLYWWNGAASVPAGKVEAIFLAGVHGEQPRRVEVAVGHHGQGLEGDRNFGDDDPDSCNITLIEAEAFERQRDEHGLDLDPADARRQVLVRGVDLG